MIRGEPMMDFLKGAEPPKLSKILIKGAESSRTPSMTSLCNISLISFTALFKVYYGGTNEMYAMFECIGGDSVNWMICVDSDLKLSARVRIYECSIINIYLKNEHSPVAVLGTAGPGAEIICGAFF